MQLFLQGAREIGKSTLLRTLLTPYAPHLSGFAVQRMMQAGGRVGFCASVVNQSCPSPETAYHTDLPGIFILRGQMFPAVLESVLLEAARAACAPHCRLILLDEIGGIELDSPAVFAALESLLALEKPCIGVLKSEENLLHTVSKLGLDRERYLGLHRRLSAHILHTGQLLTLQDENRAALTTTIEKFLKQIF